MATTEAASKRDEILDAAEGLIRTVGFNGFSTRDVADTVGIKAASVHYYFPTKADIGVAVVGRYTERFLDGLGDPKAFGGDARKAIARYVAAFRRALVRDGKLCLCGVLGAEIGSLPPDVGERTRAFFERSVEWLKSALSPGLGAARAKASAFHILAAMEGAMIISKTLGDDGLFDSVGKTVMMLAEG